MPVYVLSKGALARATTTGRTEAADIATVCRDAANAFCAGAASEAWDKPGLAKWLQGPYAEATSFGPQPDRTMACFDDSPALSSLTVRRLVGTTLAAVYEAVERAMDGCPPDFVRPLVRNRAVFNVAKGDAPAMWIALDTQRLTLRDRVLSLFAVDKLVHPENYVAPFFLCALCGAVLLGDKRRAAGLCQEHDRPSGVVPR